MIELTPEELRKEVRQLEDLEDAYREAIEETGGEITPAIEIVERGIAGFTGDIFESLHWYKCEAEATEVACKAEEARLAEVRKRAEGRAAWAKTVAKAVLERRGVRKVKTRTVTVYLQQAPEKLIPTGDEEPEPGLLPARFQNVKITAKKDEIRKALKAGEQVDDYKMGHGPDTVVFR